MRLTKRQFAYLCCLMVFMSALSTAVWWLLTSPLMVDKAQISINKKGQRVYQNEPFTGEMVSYHASGKRATADQFLEGRRQGYSKKWFADGTLGFESNYALGVRHGVTKSWWYNGNARSEVQYVDGKQEGVAWQWYRSGAKFKKFNYVAGKSFGLQQGWRENGKLFSNFEYKNGRIYGLRKANTCVGLEDETISVNYVKNQS